jgi:hypothetical protein
MINVWLNNARVTDCLRSTVCVLATSLRLLPRHLASSALSARARVKSTKCTESRSTTEYQRKKNVFTKSKIDEKRRKKKPEVDIFSSRGHDEHDSRLLLLCWLVSFFLSVYHRSLTLAFGAQNNKILSHSLSSTSDIYDWNGKIHKLFRRIFRGFFYDEHENSLRVDQLCFLRA